MKTSEIQNQFNAIAEEYDVRRAAFIPCFDAFYGETTEFLAASVSAPKRILDLGAGTGILAGFWYRHFPEAQYVLVDVAEDMLDVARRRFEGLDNFGFVSMDYAERLPEERFDLIVSALSIHHLTDAGRQNLFARIRDRLQPNGVFANYDQFCGTTPLMTRWLDTWWLDQLAKTDLTQEDIRQWKKRRALDRECSLLAEVQMLQASGFDSVQCVFSSGKFSVICAVV